MAFASDATNLVTGDTNLRRDIFVRDLGTETTERISVNGGEVEGNGDSDGPCISDDGRYVAYQSRASNLVADDSNGTSDVFVRDRDAGTTERVSIQSDGGQGNGASGSCAISSDGRFIAFDSSGSNLVLNDSNGVADAFVHDRQNGTTELVSVNSTGDQGDDHSQAPKVSGDGRFVVFHSVATNLVSGDTNDDRDVFRRDRQGGITERLSVNDAGDQANSESIFPTISGDGQFVTFELAASNLVADDTNGRTDVFVRGPPEDTVIATAFPLGGGSVSGGGTFVRGSSRTVDAAPSAGWRFLNWTEGGASVSANGSYTFTLDADRNLTANFARETYDILVSASPTSGGTVAGGGTFAHDTERTVSATPSAHNRFINWTEGGAAVSTDPSYTSTLTDDRTLVANFQQVTHTISLSPSPTAGGTASGNGTFVEGSSWIVSATPNPGYRFVRWTENGNPISTNASYSFTLNASRTLVANFTTITYTIAVTAFPPVGGTVNGDGTFEQGSSRTVIARPNSGYRFARWTQGGVLVSTSAFYTFALNSNRNLVAQFVDPRRRNDLLVDFGSQGLWRFLNNTNWQKLLGYSPLDIAAGDLDGDQKDEAIGSFPGLGLLANYNNSATWAKLHPAAPAHIVVGDFDGNGKDDLVADLRTAGIWVLRNNVQPFVKLHASGSSGLAVGDLDGNGRDELLAVFPTGLWALYNNGSIWTKLHSASPLHLATGNFDGNRRDELVIGLKSSGIFVRYNNAGSFTRVHTLTPQGFAVGDLDANGKEELIADLGAVGMWARFNDAGWIRLHNNSPGDILTADLNRSGRGEVIAGFGTSGLFARNNDAEGWLRLNALSEQAMSAGGFD